MAGRELIAQPLRSTGSFNWLYLIEWIVNGILFLFFLFYWHRLVSTVLSYGIRLFTWHKYRIYLDIEGLQFSPLAGRLFFKGVRYHGENETIFIHNGNITWRYWLRKVKECDIFEQDDISEAGMNHGQRRQSATEEDEDTDASLPCRVAIKITGVEAFLYNRSPAYDAILENLRKKHSAPEISRQRRSTYAAEKLGFSEHIRQDDSSGTSSQVPSGPAYGEGKDAIELKELDDRFQAGLGHSTSRRVFEPTQIPSASKPPAFLRLLPVHVEVSKGAAVVGNENTKSIIVARFNSATGDFNATKSGPLDLFKILMDFDVSKPCVQMKPNVDYKLTQLDEATGLQEEAAATSTATEFFSSIEKKKTRKRHNSAKVWLTKFGHLAARYGQSTESVAHHTRGKSSLLEPGSASVPLLSNKNWSGLARYLDDDHTDEHSEWETVEYAKSSTIADLKGVSINFFWDIPGSVPEQHMEGVDAEHRAVDDINGTSPPEYGLVITVNGGRVNYGPWADRHRVVLQQIFFPAPFCDAVPATPLTPGMTRVSTRLSLAIHITDDTVLRIPFRESSKDSRWVGRAAGVAGPKQGASTKSATRKKQRKSSGRHKKRDTAVAGRDVRPYAWFDVTVKAETSVTYDMDMVAGSWGFENKLGLDVSMIEISSSLNHALLWRSGRVLLGADLSFPLSWNGLREWKFDIKIANLELFLLRDHTFLLVDLINDWGTGPPPEFFTFVPFRYLLNVHFDNFKLFLNTNDANIIDNAEDLDANEYVILYGETLDADLMIPLDRYIPSGKDILFDVSAHHLGFELCMPSINTTSTLLLDKQVARLESVCVKGTYNTLLETQPGCTDTLNMTIIGDNLTISFFGFLLHHLVKVKENYFGDNVHFRTLQEYQELVQQGHAGPDAEPISARGNNLDVILDIQATNLNILIPSGLYDATEHVWIRVHHADIDLRVNGPYLEMMVNSSPLMFGHTSRDLGTSQLHSSEVELILDGVGVFGHRLFGLPPKEPAYVSNFDIDIGEFVGECSLQFVQKLIAAAKSVALTISDDENSIPVPHSEPVYDSTYVRFQCPLIQLWMHTGDSAMLIELRNLGGNFNDLSTGLFSQRLVMSTPLVVFACAEIASHSKMPVRQPAKLHAYMRTSLSLNMVGRDFHFSKHRQLQQAHMRLQDGQSGRAAFLLVGTRSTQASSHNAADDTEPLSLPVPSLPRPLQATQETAGTSTSSSSSAQLSSSPRGEDNIQDSAFYPSSRQRTKEPSDMAREIALSAHASKAQPKDTRRSDEQASDLTMAHFPLHGLRLDLDDVPQLPLRNKSSTLQQYRHPVTPFRGSNNEDASQMSFLVDLGDGITAYCSPEAIRIFSQLMDELQPRQPQDILDNLQHSVIQEVLTIHSKRRGMNTLVDVKVSVPCVHLRFSHSFQDDEDQENMSRSDKYNLIARDLSLAARIKTVPSRKNEEDANMMHATLRSISLSAQEHAEQRSVDDAALEILIEDVLVWMLDGHRTSVNVSLRHAAVVMASTQVQYLAALIHRTTMLIDGLQANFKTVSTQHDQRLQFLVYTLIAHFGDIQGPGFLNLGSYIIRSSATHLRNSESWKIVSKMRYVLQSLDQTTSENLIRACLSNKVGVPDNGAMSVLATLDNWRDWDTTRAADTVAMRVVYGNTNKVAGLHDRSTVPLSLSIRSEELELIVDPGSKQNDLTIRELAVGVSISPPPPPPVEMQWFETYKETKETTIQIDNAGIKFNLNWHLCPLVDRLIVLFEKSAPGQLPVNQESVPQAVAAAPAFLEEMHIVFSGDVFEMILQTPHLIIIHEIQQLRVSVTGFGWKPDSSEKSVNLITTAGAASLAMNGHDRPLWRTEVVTSTVWVSFDEALIEGSAAQNLKVVGDSKKLLFEVQEDVAGLIEIVDAVIADEAVYVKRLIDTHAESVDHTSVEVPVSEPRVPLQIHVALFLNYYSIRFAILKELQYAIDGRVARAAVVPDVHMSSTYFIDFDLKTQTHQLMNIGDDDEAQTVCEIEMPPVNGSIRLLQTKQIATASATLCVERWVVDGRAIYGIVSTISSPRFQSAVEAIMSDVQTVQKRIMETLPSITSEAKPATAKDAGKPFIFDANMTFGGLVLSIDTSPDAKHVERAQVLFEVHAFHLRTANRSNTPDVALPAPEIRLVLEQITLDLQTINHRMTRNCGSVAMGVHFTCTVDAGEDAAARRAFTLSVFGPDIDIFAETAPAAASILVYLQRRLKHLDLAGQKKYFRRLRQADASPSVTVPPPTAADKNAPDVAEELQEADKMLTTFAFELQAIRVAYLVRDSVSRASSHDRDNLVLTLKSLNLLARSQEEAKLSIEDLEVALTNPSMARGERSRNSALLPEIIFNVVYQRNKTERKFVFHAAGKALDVQLEPLFMLPVNDIERSITLSKKEFQKVVASLEGLPSTGTAIKPQKLFGERELTFLLISADFAGAVVQLKGQRKEEFSRPAIAALNLDHNAQHGRYGQFVDDNAESVAILRAPGISLRLQYQDPRTREADLNVELRIDASSNTLQPSVVPLILQITESVKQLVRDTDDSVPTVVEVPPTPGEDKPQENGEDAGTDDNIVTADPHKLLGRTRLNVGFRICRQEFALSCQPIAKVAASAKLDDIYITINTVESSEHGNFFAISAAVTDLSVSLRHVYSRDPTLNFEIESIILSVMNSKHIKGTSGISAILKINPSRAQVNARQIGDALLFREIWLPPEIRDAAMPATPATTDEPQEYFVSRYKELAASTAFPWHATVAIAELAAELDFGQAIGKTSLSIRDLWASSNKNTNSQQNLCIGIDGVEITSTGRMSGFVSLEKVKARTSIAWPASDAKHERGPLVQGSIGFDCLMLKVAFDYQAFAAVEIGNFEFVMYNVRDSSKEHGDRLVAILDGDKVHAFITSSAAASGVAVFQAFERLVQERRANYQQSLKEIGKFLRRKSSVYRSDTRSKIQAILQSADDRQSQQEEVVKQDLTLHTDVVVTLRSLVVGAFPVTLLDQQILKAEASDIQARFAATLEDDERVHSGLGLTLGELSVALSSVPRGSVSHRLDDIAVEDVVRNALSAKGGVILKVPKVLAAMQTWQSASSLEIDYVFRSTFQGKIDIGWNYSRISFIRGMWATHARTLASRLGKPLPESTIKIRGGPKAAHDEGSASEEGAKATAKQEKITAEVKLPQSKYVYRAMEPPVIETPQLRDLGESTPPLEWVGLHRERLPNLTHQIVIVALLGIAKEVEDAYTRILGNA